MTKYSIIKLQNNDYDAETEAYLKDLKGHLSSVINGLEKIPGDIKTEIAFMRQSLWFCNLFNKR